MERTEDIMFPMICDHIRYGEAVKYMSEMFEREVFDSAVALYSTGTLISVPGILSLKKDLLLFKDGVLIGSDVPSPQQMKGRRFILVGDVLTSGSVASELIKTIVDNGGTVVKLGFVVEDGQFNARKKSLKGYPVESMIRL